MRTLTILVDVSVDFLASRESRNLEQVVCQRDDVQDRVDTVRVDVSKDCSIWVGVGFSWQSDWLAAEGVGLWCNVSVVASTDSANILELLVEEDIIIVS